MLHDDRNREEVRRLEDDFFDWFETADAEELEGGTLDGFLEELERVAPLPGSFDPEKSLAGFHEKYAAFLDPQKEEKRKGRMSRRAFFAAAAVAAALACMITAQALGVDIFGFFGRWTNETFSFTNSADKAGYQGRKLFYPFEEGETAKFPSLNEALAAFRINLPLAPHWIPERFAEFEVEGSVTPLGVDIYAFAGVEGDRKESLKVHYRELGDDGPFSSIEKDENAPITYESGDVLHYMMTDHGVCTAAWIRDNIECMISGTVTTKEMEQIIDSIYLEEGEEPGAPIFPENQETRFDSIEEALEEFQMDIAAPKWFPERYGEFEVSGVVMTGYKSVYACTLPEQSNFLSLSYTEKGGDDPKTVIEKDDNTPILYESGGVRHYILTDHEWRKATWIQGDIECIIRGIATEEEMKRIIDSIYS